MARSADGMTIGIRDSKSEGTGPVLEFTRAEWAAFTAGLRRGADAIG